MLRRRAVQQRGCLVASFYCSGTTLFICCLFGFNYSKDMLLYLCLSLSHFIGLIAGDTISPQKDQISGTEGQTVKLRCNYETTAGGALLYWYKHLSDLQAPQFILYKGAKSLSTAQHIPDKRYESQTSDSTTELTIRTLTLADTALYYCALRAGRGGSGVVVSRSYALTFGNPIKLTVVHSDSSFVPPALFVLRSLPPEGFSGSSPPKQGPDVCLAAGFRPKDGQMVLKVDDSSDPITQETTNAVLHTKMKTYFYAGFTSKTLESCELHNTKAQREPEKAPCPTETSAQSPAQETETLVGVYPEQAKENHFLLLMNGIRVVFTKTLAFNTLLTIRSLLF